MSWDPIIGFLKIIVIAFLGSVGNKFNYLRLSTRKILNECSKRALNV
jgi:hypothetical protein